MTVDDRYKNIILDIGHCLSILCVVIWKLVLILSSSKRSLQPVILTNSCIVSAVPANILDDVFLRLLLRNHKCNFLKKTVGDRMLSVTFP